MLTDSQLLSATYPPTREHTHENAQKMDVTINNKV